MHSKNLLLTAATAVLAGSFASASPISVGQGAFTSPTTISFNSIADEAPITTQFSGSGVTFSGGVFGLTSGGDTSLFPDTPTAVASDWLYSQDAHGTLPITVTFSSVQNLVGFFQEVNTGDSTTITTFLNGVSDGSVTQGGTSSAAFFGVSDSSGFNSITINVTGSVNDFIAFDSFEFQGTSGGPSGVPEPGYGYLSAAVLALVALKQLHARRRGYNTADRQAS